MKYWFFSLIVLVVSFLTVQAAGLDQTVTIIENSNQNSNTNTTTNSNNSNNNTNTNTNANTNQNTNTANQNSNTNTTTNTSNQNTNQTTTEPTVDDSTEGVVEPDTTNTNQVTHINANTNTTKNTNTNSTNQPPVNVVTNTVSNTNSIVPVDSSDPVQPSVIVDAITNNPVAKFIGDTVTNTIAAIEDQLPPVVVANIKKAGKSTSKFVKSTPGQVTTTTLQTAGVVSWTAVATTQIAATSMTTVQSLSDLYIITVRFFGAIFGIARKKKRPWGTVYDSVTKRPLDPAYVLITTADGKEIQESFTDLDGRYGFLLPAGQYNISAQKTNYKFPSEKLHGRPQDELYTNLYFGEPVTTTEGELIVRNIPLDPVKFDWNEFEKNKENQFRFYSQRKRILSIISYLFYGIGFVAAVVTTVFDPKPFNIILLLVYTLILGYQLVWLPHHRAAKVSYSDGTPVPFAILRFFSAKLNKEVKSIVADQHGRFYILVEPTRYYITVEVKQPDETYRKVHQTEVLELTTGTVKHNIVVPAAPVLPPTPNLPPAP